MKYGLAILLSWKVDSLFFIANSKPFLHEADVVQSRFSKYLIAKSLYLIYIVFAICYNKINALILM